ncbi:MAG: YqaA family protein [Desulfopila sp.]
MNTSTSRKRHEKRIGHWLERLKRSRHVMWLFFGLSFLETIILPIPIEFVLIPFMLTNRHRLWKTAAYVTAGCLAASLFGYGMGYFLFETAGEWIINTMRWQQGYEKFQNLFDLHGFFAILMVGVVPIPFQTAMLTAGAAGYPVWKFILAATLARGIRYFGLAWLVFVFGEQAENLWQNYRFSVGLGLAIIVGVLWALTQWLSSAVI